MIRSTVLATVVVLSAASHALAATEAPEFVEKAAVSGLFEVESSQIAIQQSQDQRVRAFAQMMVADHQQANEKLKSLATSEGITVPSKMDDAHEDKLEELRNAGADDFDETYVLMQVEAHEQAVELFETYASEGDNEALRSLAADTLPILERHLAEITAIEEGLAKAH